MNSRFDPVPSLHFPTFSRTLGSAPIILTGNFYSGLLLASMSRPKVTL